MVSVFSESYKRYYYAPWLSFPTCVTITCFIIGILLPFFAQFSNDNFWNPIDTFYEHPVIQNKNEFIIYGLTSSESFFSLSNFDRMTSDSSLLISSNFQLIDDDNDNIVDKITFTATINEESSPQNIKILLFFDYFLQEKTKIQFQSMCYVDISPNGGTDIKTKGTLMLKQKEPLKLKPFIDFDEGKDFFTSGKVLVPSFDEIYEEFTTKKKMTTKYDYISNVKNIGAPINIQVDIEIPKYQEVIYAQPPYINLKFKWIQYLALLLPTLIIINYFIGFAFQNKIFDCSVLSNIPKAMY